MSSTPRLRIATRKAGLSLALTTALIGPPVSGASADPGEWILRPGETLGPDQSLVSADGGFTLRMRRDGNLVQYSTAGEVVWATHTTAPENRDSVLRIRQDGNAVIIAPGNRPVWSTGTQGNPGSTLELENDGNLVVYAPGRRPVWARSNTPVSPPNKPVSNPDPGFYVAMGDSFSSGEGVPPFDKGTATETNWCHRSPNSWARLLSEKVEMPIHPDGHLACSGAVTDNIIEDGQYNEWSQLDQLRELPASKFITLTIGGNDIAFADTVATCYLSDEADCLAAVETSNALIHDVLPLKLANVYTAIRAESQGQKIIVVGYPNLMTKHNSDLGRCPWLSKAGRASLVGMGELIDRTIAESVRSAQHRGVNIEYVSTLDLFAGHELCTGTSYMWEITIPNAMEGYAAHPRIEGQELMAERVAQAVRRLGLAR